MKFQREKYRETEADLVGEFYFQARLAGLEVYLEVKLPSTVHRSGEMRVDAVVVNGDEIICCVELKRTGKKLSAGTRQTQAYRSLEYNHRIQTVWINDRAGIPVIVQSIVELMNENAEARTSAFDGLGRFGEERQLPMP